jgi:mannitol-1-phosphate 5-dehydrogenase
MALAGTRTFVGFGFGAIQAGLFLYEAYQSGAFGRMAVAEVLPDVVADVRAAGGMFTVNVAHADRVEAVQIGPVAIENPAVTEDRARLIRAVAEAHEMATAVPSVDYYAGFGDGSLHRILAEGLRRKAAAGGPQCVVYAAENHNRAASILAEHVMDAVPAAERDAVSAQVRFVDTVIAKMCGVHEDAPDLAPVVPNSQRTFLVESFNRILISRIDFASGLPFDRGISAFEEKDDLLPFEEAKLYGHNAVHALAAYTGAVCGVDYVAELSDRTGMLAFLRNALVRESGAALVARYGGLDEFFTPDGYAEFADDLLARMVNPHLRDTVARVGRDPARKLAWDDRLIGAMRFCRAMGVRPDRYAFGAAAALYELDGGGNPDRVLPILWQPDNPDPGEEAAILALVHEGQAKLERWRAGGFGDPEALFA